MTPAASPAITEEARAKVNLTLKVLGRRPDGFHELDSLVVFPDVGDRVSVTGAEELSLAVTGPFAAALGPEDDNLVLKAARLLAGTLGIEPRAAIGLEKRLPVASGLGGGSADAAAALRALNRLWDARLDDMELERLAASLGADVAVCVRQQPRLMRGLGERLDDAPALPSFALALANAGIPVPTPAVFGALGAATLEEDPRPVAYPRFPKVKDLAAFISAMGNDLQAPAIGLHPVIGDVLAPLERQPGALAAGLSGSGGTCFALFSERAEAERACDALKREQPNWWVEPASVP